MLSQKMTKPVTLREQYASIDRETPAQKRIRSALAGFPYGGGRLQLDSELTYELIADNLETLSATIAESTARSNADTSELRELKAAIRAVRKIFDVQP